MLFWFKKKTLVLDCITYRRDAYDHFPVDRAIKFLPDWYKRLPKKLPVSDNSIPGPTMKKCQGFLNYFKNSIAVPAWDYLYITAKEHSGHINSASVEVNSHSRPQYGDFLDETYLQHKLVVPWLLYSSRKTLFTYTFPTWCYEAYQNPERILNLPGVLDFYYQHATNFNFFTRKPSTSSDEYRITLEPNKPIAFITPMEDVNIKIKHHLVTKEDYDGRTAFILSLGMLDHYKIRKKTKNARQSGKCPFGFGNE